MMGTRGIVTLVFVAVLSAPLAASPVLHLTMYGAGEFSEDPDAARDVSDQFRHRSGEDLYTGVAVEVVFGRVGVGGRYATRFTAFDVPESADWNKDRHHGVDSPVG